MKITILLTLFILGACSSGKLTDKERAVRILKKSDPDKSCVEIKRVYALGMASFDDYGREEDLKRATYKAGGNTVTLDRIDQQRTHYGTAYKCQ